MTESDIKDLKDQLKSPGSLIADLDEYKDYFSDATIYNNRPEAILIVESVDDLQTSINFCHLHKLPFVIRGAGTGLSGGCVPTDNSLLISVEKLNRIDIDKEGKIAVVQTGAITKELMDEAKKVGLTYLPDPASYDESTLGGNASENAGGLRCVKFGVTRDYVLGLKIILPDGSLLNTGYFNKDEAFNLTDLFVGSEGTLGVIYELALKLSPIPDTVQTILAAFEKVKDAAQTVSDIRIAGIIPTVLEFLDSDAVACSNEYEKNDGLDKAGAILLIEANKEETIKIEEIAHQNRSQYVRIENEPDKVEQLWKVRRNISNAIKAGGKIRISEDIAVPISKFPIIVEFVAKLNKNSSLRINSFGHAGDGNLHVNFLSPNGTVEEITEIEVLVLGLMEETLSLGGTLTGEHGIGLAKKHLLHNEYDQPTLDAMKSFKTIFDPDSILNSDKIF